MLGDDSVTRPDRGRSLVMRGRQQTQDEREAGAMGPKHQGLRSRRGQSLEHGRQQLVAGCLERVVVLGH